MDENNSKVIELLTSINSLLFILLKLNMEEKLKELEKDEIAVYDLTGRLNRDQIAKELKISTGKVSNIWSNLENKILIEKTGTKFKKVLE